MAPSQGHPPSGQFAILEQHSLLIQKVKQDLNAGIESTFAKRKAKFIEKPEPLAVQKLLYPSKFRKDPYLKKNTLDESD